MTKKVQPAEIAGCFHFYPADSFRKRLSRVSRRVIREILHGIGFPHAPAITLQLYHSKNKIDEESLMII